MEDSAWPEVGAAISSAPYPVHVLPVDPASAQACPTALGFTTRSWLGAVVANAGGLLVDNGWLRVLGSGCQGLPDVVAEAEATTGQLTVAYDVMGGVFAWLQPHPSERPTIHYFGPDTLDWQDLNQGYADWLYAVLAGSLTQFYDTLRWPGWEAEVGALDVDQGISAWPPPWTREGKDLSTVSRKAIPLGELVSFCQDTARQLGSPQEG